MSTDNTTANGGPAFPLQSIGPDFAPGYAGMTLRDYFAIQALASGVGDSKWTPAYSVEDKARNAYRVADAMLKAREAA